LQPTPKWKQVHTVGLQRVEGYIKLPADYWLKMLPNIRETKQYALLCSKRIYKKGKKAEKFCKHDILHILLKTYCKSVPTFIFASMYRLLCTAVHFKELTTDKKYRHRRIYNRNTIKYSFVINFKERTTYFSYAHWGFVIWLQLQISGE
jgi:hypothetical protein